MKKKKKQHKNRIRLTDIERTSGYQWVEGRDNMGVVV